MLTHDIKVSITMPVYNHEKYIEQAIESVLMQQVNFRYELLIGEDCSTDRSLELINKYKNYEQIKIFAREKNMNKAPVRNGPDLMMKAKGKYIITLEGDDYWTDSQKLQKQVDFLDEHPDYIACGHKFKVVDERGCSYRDEDFECQFFQDNPYNKDVFERGLMLSHLNTLMYRNFFSNNDEAVELFSKYTGMGTDFLLTSYLVLRGRIFCINDIMSCYRKVTHYNSSSFSASMEKNNRRDMVYKCVLESEKFLNNNYQISFFVRKKSAYASAVFKWNRERSKKNFKVVTNIIKMSGTPFRYTGWLIYLLVTRFIYDIIGKKNKRIPF